MDVLEDDIEGVVSETKPRNLWIDLFDSHRYGTVKIRWIKYRVIERKSLLCHMLEIRVSTQRPRVKHQN